MKSRIQVALISLILLFSQDILFAQDTANHQNDYFKISLQYRMRPEFRKGYRTLAEDTSKEAFFIGQRARFIFDYKKDKIKFYSSIQDSRTWGDEEQKKDIAGLQVNELWIEMALQKGFAVKIGRQELVYDDQRLLGNADWGNLNISHDVLVIKYANPSKSFNWHLGGAFNQLGEPVFGTVYTLNNYKYLAFSWLKKDLAHIHSSISAIAVINGLNSTDTSHKGVKSSYTAGPVFSYKNKGLKGLLGVYYQGGYTPSNLDIHAYMLNGYVEYRKQMLFGGIGVDLLSGNSDNTSKTESDNFSTLYATNHKFYGYMDYFLSFPTDTKQRGLTDMFARLGLSLRNDFTAVVDVHSFALANANNTGTQKIGTGLGTEFDLAFEYKPSPLITLQAGYSMMFATKNMELLKGGNANNYNGWAFFMLKVFPTLFVHEFNK